MRRFFFPVASIIILLTASLAYSQSSVSMNVALSPPPPYVSGMVNVSASTDPAVSIMKFYVDGGWVYSSPPPVSFNWNSATVTDGTHVISIAAYSGYDIVVGTSVVDVTVTNSTIVPTAVPTPSPSATPTPTATATPVAAIKLPLEVIGPAGETATASFTLTAAQAASAASLWMQANNLSYPDKASVQVNGSSWINLDNNSVQVADPGKTFGGIGGPFATLKLTLSEPSGSFVAGNNTVSFRMNQTDGVSAGFRILSFNLLDASGNQLLSPSTFTQDDPSTWTPPLNTPTDIAAGQSLWSTAPLVSSSLSGAKPIQAHCADCHTQSGKDLKYFNFSNYSIIQRSAFHGLSTQQGQQIASFIRSINFPNPGRAWNPPYQPGPGIQAQPVSNWAAGAGVGAILDHDSDTIPYLFPNGINQTAVAANGWVDIHEIPSFLPLPTWNQWLPTIHPLDAWGAPFSSSSMYARYQYMRSTLTSNLTAYITNLTPGAPSSASGLGVDFYKFIFADRPNLFGAVIPGYPNPAWTQSLSYQILQTGHWQLVKNWELMQEFNLEGQLPQSEGFVKTEGAISTSIDDRAWDSGLPFFTSDNRLGLPTNQNSPSGGNQIIDQYFANAWYYLQAILFSGQRQRGGNNPIDWAYMYGTLGKMNGSIPYDNSALFTLIFTRGMQENVTAQGLDPIYGWNPGWGANVQTLVYPEFTDTNILWTALPAATRGAVMTAVLQSWFEQVQVYSPAQYYQAGFASATYMPVDQYNSSIWGDLVYDMIPHFRSYGADGTLLNSICNWAATVWPRGNWNALKQ